MALGELSPKLPLYGRPAAGNVRKFVAENLNECNGILG